MIVNEAAINFIKVCQIESHRILISPTLYTKEKRGKIRRWWIKVAILQKDVEGQPPRILTTEDLKNVPSPTAANEMVVFWSENQLEGSELQISAHTLVHSGKNIGRVNETTPFIQAVLEAESAWKSKRKKSGAETNPKRLTTGETIEELIAASTTVISRWRVFPMALHPIDDYWERVVYPCYIQRKFDGTRLIIVSHPQLPALRVGGKEFHIDAYLRKRNPQKFIDHILNELGPVLAEYPGIYLDGELYLHGYGLQQISGIARRTKKAPELQLQFHVFDCFQIGNPLPFEARWKLLQSIFSSSVLTTSLYVKLVETILVDSYDDLNAYYHQFVDEGYEGAVVRMKDAVYQYGQNSEVRSYFNLKFKHRPDAEWPVIGFGEGTKGKERGAVLWICAENDEGVEGRLGELPPLTGRLTFRVTPNWPYEIRRAIFVHLNSHPEEFNEKLYGQLLTIQYSILSKDLLPQQPKGLYFRDEGIQNWIQSLGEKSG